MNSLSFFSGCLGLDLGLKKAGHTHCVFAATYKQLKEMTNATESDEIT